MVCILFSWIPSALLNCMNPLVSLILLPLQVFSGFLHSGSTISDSSLLKLAPCIKSFKVWCLGRALLLPVSLAGKISFSELINYFSSHPKASEFWAYILLDDVDLNDVNKKNDQSPSFLHWHQCSCFRDRAAHFSYKDCYCGF